MVSVDSKFMNLDPSRTYYENLRDENENVNQSRMTLEPLGTTGYDLDNNKKQVSFNDMNSAAQNKSLYEQYRLQATETAIDESLYSKINTKDTNNNLQKSAQRAHLNTQTTPMYTKNPNMSNNKINEILNLSRNMITDFIEPSPSGITRCYVKFDEPAPVKREVPKPIADYVQVEYQNPTKYKPYSVAEISHTRDCSTSPFVFLKTQLNEIQPKVTEQMRLEASKAVVFSDAATQFNETAVQNTPVVTQKNQSNLKSIQTRPIISEEPQVKVPIVKDIDRQEVHAVVHEVANEVVQKPKKLAKSKVIFVNLTPKVSDPPTKEADPQDTSNFGYINENLEQLNTTVIGGDDLCQSTSYQHKLDDSSFVDKLANSARQHLSQRLMTITEENDNQINEPSGNINQKSSFYYDNIIKNKMEPINDSRSAAVTQEIFTPAISKDERNLEIHHSQNAPLELAPQHVQHFNYISQNNSHGPSYQVDEPQMNNLDAAHRNEIEQRDQIMQFPTPNEMMFMNQHELTNANEDFVQPPRLKRVNLSNFEENAENLPKEIKTYYDGKTCWTSLPADQTGLNQWYRPTENEPQNENNDRLDRHEVPEVKKRNDLHVKIQLPNENVNKETIEKPTNERKGQRCCLKIFIFFVLLVVVALLAFFIGFDDYARKTFFNVEFWKSFKSAIDAETLKE